jgi:hypothetical protein
VAGITAGTACPVAIAGPHEVVSGVFVPLWAVSTTSLLRSDAFAAQSIFAVCYRLKMGRVDTERDAAQVVELQSIWNWPAE